MLRSRRHFLLNLGFGSGGLVLAGCLRPTEASGSLADYPGIATAAAATGAAAAAPAKNVLAPTEDNILGPYHRKGAPYRAKITPPYEPGKVLLVSGIVRGADTGKPLPMATLDIWQANENGRYDNDDPKAPPAAGVYLLRARLVTNEDGYYEYETIHPGAYQIGPKAWRPAHIHYWVEALGYQKLVTQMYFQGDPHNKTDDFIRDSLIMPVNSAKSNGQAYEVVKFDIVLAKA